MVTTLLTSQTQSEWLDRIAILDSFVPSGDPAQDVPRLLTQLGDKSTLDWLQQAARDADDWLAFALEVRTNHEVELARLYRGQTLRWSAETWRPDQGAVYLQVLDVEHRTWSALIDAACS